MAKKKIQKDTSRVESPTNGNTNHCYGDLKWKI